MLLAVAFVFVGNHAFTADQLRARVIDKLADPQVPGDLVMDDDRLARATMVVSAYYWDRGYATVQIADPEVTGGEVTIRIDEGPRFTISSVAITGHPLGDPRGDLALVTTHARSRFSRAQIAADLERLSDDYGDRGYAFASVIPITHIDVEHETIGLDFEIDPGERAVIDEIEVHANSRDDEARIRRSLGIVVGLEFSHIELMDAKERASKVVRSAVDVAVMHGATKRGVKIILETRE